MYLLKLRNSHAVQCERIIMTTQSTVTVPSASDIAEKFGFSAQHVGRIMKKMNTEYAPYDENFYQNRKKPSYEGWHITDYGEVEYGNYYLIGNLTKNSSGRLFFSGNENRTEEQSRCDSTIIFNS